MDSSSLPKGDHWLASSFAAFHIKKKSNLDKPVCSLNLG
jgi:hypothetical protein